MGCMPYGRQTLFGFWQLTYSFNPSYGLHALRATLFPPSGTIQKKFQSLIWVACPTGCDSTHPAFTSISYKHVGSIPEFCRFFKFTPLLFLPKKGKRPTCEHPSQPLARPPHFPAPPAVLDRPLPPSSPENHPQPQLRASPLQHPSCYDARSPLTQCTKAVPMASHCQSSPHAPDKPHRPDKTEWNLRPPPPAAPPDDAAECTVSPSKNTQKDCTASNAHTHSKFYAPSHAADHPECRRR